MHPTKAQGTVRSLGATPDELRSLVLDYLCHNACSSTLRAFLRDTSVRQLDADGDEVMTGLGGNALGETVKARLASGELRKEIRTCILSGQIDDAIELLNKYFPSVLAENVEVSSSSNAEGRLEYIPSTSVNPAHLLINLHVQSFIETARSVPLPYHPPGARFPVSPVSAPEDTAMDQEAAAATKLKATERLLHRAQNLYAEANRLPVADDRSQYLSELGKVGSLLAYTEPEFGPVALYLGQDRREALADDIDSAILYRTGQSVISNMELATRQTSVVWSMLHEQKFKPPPRSTWPAGVSLTGPAKPNAQPAAATTKKTTSEPDIPEVFASFDLHSFLDSGA